MRNHFARRLLEIAKADPRVFLITGDLGFGVLDEFAETLPLQFLNVGVAEQNMTGIATGLALEGRIVFTYSICNFPTLRCLEQVRNDVAYHRANVKIVSVGGGFCYGALGFSHHGTEDLAIMRAIPGMSVLAPGDPTEVQLAVDEIYRTSGAFYLRLGKGGEPLVHPNPDVAKAKFCFGEALEVINGAGVVIVSTGGMLEESYQATLALRRAGIDCGLFSMHTVKPLDVKTVRRLAQSVPLIVTVEEHTRIGGLGGAVAEVLAELPQGRAQLKILGVGDNFSEVVGSQDYLRTLAGLDREAITNSILSLLKDKK